MEPSRIPFDAEFAGDLGNRTVHALVPHGRGARDDSQGCVLGEHGDDFIGHAVGEIILRGVARKIRQRKNCDGMNPGRLAGPEQKGANTSRIHGEERGGKREDDEGRHGRPPSAHAGLSDDRRRRRWFGWSERRLRLGWTNRRGIGNEAVSLAGDSLDEARLFGIIAQDLADLADGGVDSVFGIDEDVLAPEAIDDFLAGGDAALFLNEKEEEFHRDALQFQHAAMAA